MKLAAMKRVTPLLMVLALFTAACGGSGDDETPDDGPSVAASTTWTAAIAALAGASYIHVVTPGGITDPPRYQPDPSDLGPVVDAEYLLVDGTESFAADLAEMVADEAEVVELTVAGNVDMVESEVMRLAELFGTTEAAEDNLADVLPQLTAMRNDVVNALPEPVPVVIAEESVSGWAEWAGLSVADTYGPSSAGAATPGDLDALQPTLILTSAHVPGTDVGGSGAASASLTNFPGDNLDLVPVFERNRNALLEALQGS